MDLQEYIKMNNYKNNRQEFSNEWQTEFRVYEITSQYRTKGKLIKRYKSKTLAYAL